MSIKPMHKAYAAPRCRAKSKRTGKRCRAPAVRGWKVCAQPVGLAFRRAQLNNYVLILGKSRFVQARPERCNEVHGIAAVHPAGAIRSGMASSPVTALRAQAADQKGRAGDIATSQWLLVTRCQRIIPPRRSRPAA